MLAAKIALWVLAAVIVIEDFDNWNRGPRQRRKRSREYSFLVVAAIFYVLWGIFSVGIAAFRATIDMTHYVW